MTFIPHKNRIWFEPLKKDTVILSDKEEVIEAGKVLGFGSEVKDIQIGDTIHFIGWGAEETTDGNWVVRDDPSFILGITR